MGLGPWHLRAFTRNYDACRNDATTATPRRLARPADRTQALHCHSVHWAPSVLVLGPQTSITPRRAWSHSRFVYAKSCRQRRLRDYVGASRNQSWPAVFSRDYPRNARPDLLCPATTFIKHLIHQPHTSTPVTEVATADLSQLPAEHKCPSSCTTVKLPSSSRRPQETSARCRVCQCHHLKRTERVGDVLWRSSSRFCSSLALPFSLSPCATAYNTRSTWRVVPANCSSTMDQLLKLFASLLPTVPKHCVRAAIYCHSFCGK
ncbi:hypothetical protein C0Q70_13502 [Pomacea canaliculata]|uniref:Uncharacterized protein n=1 Tax=Pomacea canaliculata TaxID=400727 RepID=A0A2T7NXE8_POMCA|nr:hypothetical protein C0Q70_13502 [Pomacea canaliculata]